MGYVFYDLDCSESEDLSLVDDLIGIVDGAAKSAYANDWVITNYLLVGIDILKIYKAFCVRDKNDYLGEGSFLVNKESLWIDKSHGGIVGFPINHWTNRMIHNGRIDFYYKTILY